MENQEIKNVLEEHIKIIDRQSQNIGIVINLIGQVSNAIDEGFEEINRRLAVLEGKEGMQGVNQQLGHIKSEISKIAKAYPYEDLYKNIQDIAKGQA